MLADPFNGLGGVPAAIDVLITFPGVSVANMLNLSAKSSSFWNKRAWSVPRPGKASARKMVSRCGVKAFKYDRLNINSRRFQKNILSKKINIKKIEY